MPWQAHRKIADWDSLVKVREQARRDGKIVVWTNGCFDLLHVGHVRSLQAARALGDLLIVGLNSDQSVVGLKGPGRPIIPELERAEIISALECVDYVIVFDELTPCGAIGRLRPDIHCKGADYADKPVPEREIVESYGGRVEFLPFDPAISTSDLVQRIREGEAPAEPRLCGKPPSAHGSAGASPSHFGCGRRPR